ncbi:transcriptional regulator [Dictyobacter alpinus]|uniref:Transcriptional regulator n=1 Tax=Dictyobacter alpinus TaxID=2014873 RepID=A0A402BBF3_9CHLR|nr:DUF4188 domain-containing protein [Dictyobacter alpinus]GCE28723.1 transcriptional regulator [Dictyobacter alpinus]
MATVVPGRFTAQIDQPFVVFLIGMRINKFFALRRWVPTVMSMGPMLRSLYQHPELGFLGAETYLSLRGPVMIQYWRSFEDLEKFARAKDEPHLSAWRRFNRAIGTDGSVGIWHETYVVEPGKYEAVYGNMPVFGLASATQHVPATGRRETARRRLGGEGEPAVPSPVQAGVEATSQDIV